MYLEQYLEPYRCINDITIIIRVLLSVFIGGIIGIERGRKRHPAGFRTYMLVCLGATLVMMTNQYIYQAFSNGDISRLGAQVINGIGFLGAGTIMVTRKNQVRGLTTAAGLWSSACLGLAIGIGFYEGAIVVGFAILFIMTVMQKFDSFVQSKSTLINIYASMTSQESVSTFISYCKEKEYKIIDMQINKDKEAGKHQIILFCTMEVKKGMLHVEVLEGLSKLEGINSLEKL